ncbi:MAG: hypothetical protein K2M19_03240 [Muribaculaceae bacterium]|nr:hypothetical protein [Muribaculaceae bacterium]
MKKTLLSLLAMSLAAGVSAQVVEVTGLKEVKTSKPLSVNLVKVSPDGSYAIVSDIASTALHKVNLSTGATSVVTSNGSALELKFSPDSRSVVFKRSVTGDHRLRYHSVESVDLATGVEHQLAKPARHAANYTVSPKGNLTIAGESAIARTVSLNGVKEAPRAVVGINKGHLEVTTPDGNTKFIDPQGRGSYLWPSLSPDGTKIVYYKSGDGCFVCDLDGSNARSLGFVHAPVWMNDKVVLGSQEYDNGLTVTASSIVAADMNGTIQTLTDASLLGMSPSVSTDGKTVTFGTADGKLYVLTLK